MTEAEALAELRAIRIRLDQLAAFFLGRETQRELAPKWDCGHRHVSRGEAIACKRAQDAGAHYAITDNAGGRAAE